MPITKFKESKDKLKKKKLNHAGLAVKSESKEVREPTKKKLNMGAFSKKNAS